MSAGVHRGKRPLGWVLLELKLLDVALWESKSGCPQEQDLLDQLYRFYKQVHFFLLKIFRLDNTFPLLVETQHKHRGILLFIENKNFT